MDKPEIRFQAMDARSGSITQQSWGGILRTVIRNLAKQPLTL